MSQPKDGHSTIHAATPNDVFRYRYHHGTNLGSCFVLEKWLSPSMYGQGANSSELEAVTTAVEQLGNHNAKSKWESHWNDLVTEFDFGFLVANAHCTSIRLPIGYFTLGPSFCKGTPFEKVDSVYTNAWAAVKAFVTRAASHGIGTLLDLHALPGGANTGDHSGTNSGKAELWGNKKYLELAKKCLCFMSQEVKSLEGVVGLQLCNEAEFNASGMYDWYDSVISAVGKVDPAIPIYISDAWNLSQAISYTAKQNSLNSHGASPIIIDIHFYWAFSDADKAKSPQQIISEVSHKLCELDGKDGNVVDLGACQVVVGEYSCVLTEDSWNKRGNTDKAQLVHQFGEAQTQRWQRSGGGYFWTYKMDWMDGGEWGFVEQTNKRAVTPPWNLTLPVQDVQSRLSKAKDAHDSAKSNAVSGHVGYWDHTSPGKHFEHWRFEQGFDTGYSDATVFFSMRSSGRIGRAGVGGDKIGCLDVWVMKRILESGMAGSYVWEFEAGLRQGVQAFYRAAGV